MTGIRWTTQAVEDLQAIHEYIARDSAGYANVVVDRIFEGVERLRAFPESGRMVPEFHRPGLREVILGVYRVVYRVRSGGVEILTVYHSSRLLDSDSAAL